MFDGRQSTRNTLLYSKLQSAIFPPRNVPFGFSLPVHHATALNQFPLRSSAAKVRDPVNQRAVYLLLRFNLIYNTGFGHSPIKSLSLVIRKMQVKISSASFRPLSRELILEAKRDVATRARARRNITDVISSAYQTRACN